MNEFTSAVVNRIACRAEIVHKPPPPTHTWTHFDIGLILTGEIFKMTTKACKNTCC